MSLSSLSLSEIAMEAEGEWVLKSDFHIIQKLVKTLPREYCVQLRLAS